MLHDRNPVYVALSDGGFRNGYTIKILNMETRERTFRLSVSGITGATLSVAGATDGGASSLEVTTPADLQHTVKIFVTAYPDNLAGEKTPMTLLLEDVNGEETAKYEAVFNAAPKPGSAQ